MFTPPTDPETLLAPLRYVWSHAPITLDPDFTRAFAVTWNYLAAPGDPDPNPNPPPDDKGDRPAPPEPNPPPVPASPIMSWLTELAAWDSAYDWTYVLGEMSSWLTNGPFAS